MQARDDHHAFGQLVERWEEPIRQLCARMTGDPHRGEDLKQETFARVFEKRKSFQPNGRFSTWLWRIALNLCYDELRRTRRRGESPLDGDQSQSRAAFCETVAETPAGEEKQNENIPASDDWDRARKELHGVRETPEVANPFGSGALPYYAEQVEALKRALLEGDASILPGMCSALDCGSLVSRW